MGQTTAVVITCGPGPKAKPGRDGDKLQARQRVNNAVTQGKMPRPDSLPCVDCGHRWTRHGDRKHTYDHYKGYAAKFHYAVEVVCTKCHAIRDSKKKKQTHCMRGHKFTDDNTIIHKNGTRHCRECFRIYDRGRRDAAFWREYRLRRKG